ncbi:MAG: LytR/AlgR family response regulator transcription factor [Emticicia sp.]|uniref:LytR/AlgR family response regulator transcription factor n=1 Tax=Emticicia sp. TaxID=1930953 RepID=UPI003BA40A52
MQENSQIQHGKLISIGSFQKIDPEEIVLFVADINYTVVYLNSGRQLLVSTHLKEIQNRFKSETFYRTHKSFFINLKYIKELKLENSKLKMQNDIDVTISRRKKDGLIRVIKN